MRRGLCGILLVIGWVFPGGAPATETTMECVVLLHGLARGPRSMRALEAPLRQAGYRVENIAYPSRKYPIEELAPLAVGRGLARCEDAGRIHFITHSLGGILVRHWLASHREPRLGRVVMLGPPNQGSEVVDRLSGLPGYRWLNGPAGYQLGTDAGSVPRRLGPVDFELGVIAGNRSINLILSRFIPGPDDGKVAVSRARVAGMRDFLVVPHTHPLMMRSDEVIRQSLHFLRHGRFDHPAES